MTRGPEPTTPKVTRCAVYTRKSTEPANKYGKVIYEAA